MKSGSHRGGKVAGLTVSEVIVALGLLAFVALVIIGVFLALLKASAKNREQAMAELLTESLLERATAAGPPSWGVGQIGTRLEATLQQDGAQFFYQVDPLEVAPDVTVNADGQCYQVTVTVGWWLEESESLPEGSREGFGNLFVKGTRTVYLRPGDRV